MVTDSKDKTRIHLEKTVDDSYDIVYETKNFERLTSDLSSSPLGSKYAVITDSNVNQLFSKELGEKLNAANIKFDIFYFPAGEQSKTMRTCETLMNSMSKLGYGRDSAIIALGGGVVGDMAGWMAYVFNRGLSYVQVPTTLLAQADSSIGGKTGVDTEHGKNLVGGIKQPKRVYINIEPLMHLKDKDYRNGLSETIKHAVIQDKDFFWYLQKSLERLKSRDEETLLYLARVNCRIKGNVVEQDVDEKGLRRILNFGHTPGHALEKVSDYELTHGEAVSIGMMVSSRIANKLGYFPSEDVAKLGHLLKSVGLPVHIPDKFSDEGIINATFSDKKSKGGRPRYVLPLGIGKMNEFDGNYATYVDDAVVMDALRKTRNN